MRAFAEQPHPRTYLVRHAGADEELARPGGRNRAGAIVGIVARADHRRIADPAPALAGQPAGGSGRGDVAFAVDRHRADGAVLEVDVEPAEVARLQFLQLPPPLGRREPVGIDHLDALLARELLGAFAAEEHVRRILHHRASQADRVPYVGHPGHRPGGAVAAVHDRGVELVDAIVGEHRAAPGVEPGIVLEHHDRGLDRVERAAAFGEHGGSRIERRPERGPVFGLLGLGHLVGRHRPRAAVNGDAPVSVLHCSAFLRLRPLRPRGGEGEAGQEPSCQHGPSGSTPRP